MGEAYTSGFKPSQCQNSLPVFGSEPRNCPGQLRINSSRPLTSSTSGVLQDPISPSGLPAKPSVRSLVGKGGASTCHTVSPVLLFKAIKKFLGPCQKYRIQGPVKIPGDDP